MDEYFGQNTPFAGRESEIYEHFFKDIPFKLPPSRTKDIGLVNFMRPVLWDLMDYLAPHVINKYNQIWRHAELLTAFLTETDINSLQIDFETKIHAMALPMCALEWNYRNAHRYTPEIGSLLAGLHSAISSEKAHPKIHQLYAQNIEQGMSSFMEETAVGGVVSVLIHYDKKAQLDAMIPLLTPETRYPFSPETYDKICVPFPRDRNSQQIRSSYKGFYSLWNNGFQANRYEIVDSKTLFVEFAASTNLRKTQTAIEVLRSDMHNCIDRLNARRVETEDHRYKTIHFKIVYLIVPSCGRKRVGGMPRGKLEETFDAWSEVYEGDDERIDEQLKSEKNEVELLRTISNKYMDRLLEVGNKLNDKWCGFRGRY